MDGKEKELYSLPRTISQSFKLPNGVDKLTKKILDGLTPRQNKMLESGRLLINPVNGDMVVPVMRQGGIAKIIVNIY